MAGTPDFSATQGFQGHEKFAFSIATDEENYLARRFPGFDKNRAYNFVLRASTLVAAIQSDTRQHSGGHGFTIEPLQQAMSQTMAGVFPVRLKADEWNSGAINWLLDVIAPDRKATASVIANFKQVVKEGDLRLHPLVTQLVEKKVLEKMGAKRKENASE